MAKKKSRKKLWIFLAIAIVIIIAVGLSLRGGKEAIKVELAKAERIAIVEKVSASGTIQPITEVKIAADVSGEIIELKVKDGDSVRLGEMLVQIRPDNLESVLERAVANLRQMRANLAESMAREARAIASLEQARLDYNRQQDLYGRKVISDADWQQAQANYKIAYNDSISAHQTVRANRFMVQSSEASVSEAEENLELTTISAPMTGTVSKLNVEKGERVVGTQTMAGTEILRIADLNAMEVRVDVNENDIIRVNLGDEVDVEVDAYSDEKFKGKVTAIANTANDKASTDAVTEFEVRIRILNESFAELVKAGNQTPFRPGMTASVEIITEVKENAIAVPLSAVTTRKPGEKRPKGRQGFGPPQEDTEEAAPAGSRKIEPIEVVFIYDNGIAKMQEVKTGISDYDNIEILSGIAEGVEIVSGPFKVVSKDLYDGDEIENSKVEEEGNDSSED